MCPLKSRNGLQMVMATVGCSLETEATFLFGRDEVAGHKCSWGASYEGILSPKDNFQLCGKLELFNRYINRLNH